MAFVGTHKSPTNKGGFIRENGKRIELLFYCYREYGGQIHEQRYTTSFLKLILRLKFFTLFYERIEKF